MKTYWFFSILLYFQALVDLFSRLAMDNIGYIDWDPQIPKVINVLHSLYFINYFVELYDCSQTV